RHVDRDQARRLLLEELAQYFARQRLGRREDEQRAALSDAREGRAAVRRADRAVEAHGRHVELLHLEVLVLEERQQRRDHHRRARQEERGGLAAEGLAGGRGQGQGDVL